MTTEDQVDSKWLLIFDNVDSDDVISICWPASKHGAVLVTTRDVAVASRLAETCIEVEDFGIDGGASFLLQMTPARRREGGETQCAENLARPLGGLPLALIQMAALVNAKKYSFKELDDKLSKYNERTHKQEDSGSTFPGYERSLDTVWGLSFETLGNDGRACLGILSFLAADSIPLEVFTAEKPEELHNSLSFCGDERRYGLSHVND